MNNAEFMLSGNSLIDAAKLLQQSGENQAALPLVKNALEKYPWDAGVAVLAGLIYQGLKEPKNAEKSFRDALSIDPQNLDAQKNLGLFLASQSRNAEALDIILSYLENADWNDYEALNNLINIADEIKEEEKTAHALKKAWEMTLSPEIGFLYARQLRLWSKHAEALPIMQLLVNNSPSPETINECAIDLQLTQQYQPAIEMYERVISWALHRQDDYDDVVAAGVSMYDIAIYKSNLASCYLASGQKKEALDTAEDALTYESRDWYPWLAKAKALQALGKYQKAADTIQEALEIDKKTSFLEKTQKERLFLLQTDALMSYQQQFVENNLYEKFQADGHWLAKAKFLFTISHYQESVAVALNALGQDEKQTGHLEQSEKEGLLLFQANLKKNEQLLTKTLKVLLDGIHTFPSNPEFHFRAASIYKKLGQLDKAIEVYENIFETLKEQKAPKMELVNYQIALGEYYLLLHGIGSGENAWEKYVRFAGANPGEFPLSLELDLNAMLAGYKEGSAAEIIEQIYKNQPDFPQSIDFMFRLRFDQGKFDDCISILSRSLGSPISDGIKQMFLNNLGYIQLLQGKYKDAHETFDRALVIGERDLSAQKDDILKSAAIIALGVAFFLDGKVLSSDWIDPSRVITSTPIQFWQPEKTIEAVKSNLATLALAGGDLDEANVLASEILCMPGKYAHQLKLRYLVLLFVAHFRNDQKTARFAWQNYLNHKKDFESEEIFKKNHPELHAWLNQTT